MLPHDNNISSRVIKTELIEWKNLVFIQQEGFKEITQEAKDKLKTSLFNNSFAQPFYVWHDESTDTLYCLDGKHRFEILNDLKSEGFNVPQLLQATFINCKDKNEAAQLVLAYSSFYAKVTSEGLFDFIKSHSLDFENLKTFVDMPNIDISILNDQFLPEPNPDELIGPSKDKPITLKITFQTTEDLEMVEETIKALLDEKCPNAFYSVSAGEL